MNSRLSSHTNHSLDSSVFKASRNNTFANMMNEIQPNGTGPIKVKYLVRRKIETLFSPKNTIFDAIHDNTHKSEHSKRSVVFSFKYEQQSITTITTITKIKPETITMASELCYIPKNLRIKSSKNTSKSSRHQHQSWCGTSHV